MATVASHLADTSALARLRHPVVASVLGPLIEAGVRASLWRSGRIRAVGIPGLLLAAVAERERVAIIHYDSDYDLIAEVTGQPIQWVVRRGSVP